MKTLNDLYQYSLDEKDFFWSEKCSDLLEKIDDFNFIIENLYFSYLKNSLIMHENFMSQKGLISKPNSIIAYKFKEICEEIVFRLYKNHEYELINIFNSLKIGDYRKLALLNIFRKIDSNNAKNVLNSVNYDEMVEILCDLENEIGESFSKSDEYREYAKTIASNFIFKEPEV